MVQDPVISVLEASPKKKKNEPEISTKIYA